jgi:hypothetical protein
MKQSDDSPQPDSLRNRGDFPDGGFSPVVSETITCLQEWFDRDGAMESAPPAPADPESRDWWTAAQALQDGLHLAARPSVPTEWTDALLRGVLADRRHRARRRMRYAVGAVLAASVLCAVTVVIIRGNRTEATAISLPDMALAVAPIPKTPPAVNLHDSIVEARAAVVSLTKRTADETVDRTFSFLSVSEPRLLTAADPWEKTLDPVAESLDEARVGAAAGFEPVTTSARRAVDRFFREINPMGQPRPEPY